MLVIRKLPRHLSVAFLGLSMAAAVPAAAQTPGTANFTVLVRGARVGSESVTVTRNPGGWQISATSQLRAPFDLTTTKFELAYGPDWQPRDLAIEGFFRGQLISLSTNFGLTTATSNLLQSGRRTSATVPVSARTIVLPTNFFGAYEALAVRLAASEAGADLPVFVAPEAEIRVTVNRVATRRIVTPEAAVDVREYTTTFNTTRGPFPVEVWVDSGNRLVRIVMPTASLLIVRDDVSSVLAREEKVRNPGDEDMFIPAAGFTLGATVTKPQGVTGRARAIILVGTSGPQDRDQELFGVPIFGQLAGALAEAGFFVVRYDRRGVGQSGGRTENATLNDYATDLIGIVNWLRRRNDVDGDRIAVAGYDDGGAIALVAAGRQNRIKAVALLAAPGQTGREVTLEQQRQALARLDLPAAERDAKIALQKEIMDAVVTGRGWAVLSEEVRYQADTPWFKSWLMFDPAEAMKRVSQPIAIIQGSVDAEVPVEHADRLETLSAGRNRAPAPYTRKVILPNVNHLLVPAETGTEAEYDTLTTRSVSPAVAESLVDWLNAVLPARQGR